MSQEVIDYKKLWKCINMDAEYDWTTSKPAMIALQGLLGTPLHDSSRSGVMQHVGPQLHETKAAELAKWVIQNWGGIGGNSTDTIASYVEGLSDYSSKAVDLFIEKRRIKGVSSWSKLLAFHDPKRWAIYDSRTAVALNIAMLNAGIQKFIPMPDSKNEAIKPAISAIKKLENISTSNGIGSIGEVEMVIFANAKLVAQRFIK